MSELRFLGLVAAVLLAVGCSERNGTPGDSGGGGFDAARRDAAGGLDAGPGLDAGSPRDAGSVDAPIVLLPDAACATANVEVSVERLPVDIVWLIDNSGSMAPAIDEVQRGMNAFADRLFASGLDYRLILLSLRGSAPVGGRYPICIPPPLAGAACADGTNFFQVDVDIKSTQPIEQFLGTLGQTTGYTMTDAVGSAPWRMLLRDGATKTIVVVTDDNSRTCTRPVGTCAATDPPLTDTSLEDFPGGGNPFNTRELGPGIRTATYGELFAGYTFDAIYGWGSETDPTVRCTYPGGTMPPSPGYTYTTLVARTGGVRAQICDGAPAWTPFFDAVATGVIRASRIACELPLPPPPAGMLLDPRRVNVAVRGSSGSTTLPYVGSAAACDPTRGGWHYDNPTMPTSVVLCPASCDFARLETATASGGGIDVLFGCESVLI